MAKREDLAENSLVFLRGAKEMTLFASHVLCILKENLSVPLFPSCSEDSKHGSKLIVIHYTHTPEESILFKTQAQTLPVLLLTHLRVSVIPHDRVIFQYVLFVYFT